MKKQSTVLILVILLAVLLAWMLAAGVGDLSIRLALSGGVILGTLYAIWGQLPNWLITLSLGSITDDDDPANISPRIYLPILLAVVTLAVTTAIVALALL